MKFKKFLSFLGVIALLGMMAACSLSVSINEDEVSEEVDSTEEVVEETEEVVVEEEVEEVVEETEEVVVEEEADDTGYSATNPPVDGITIDELKAAFQNKYPDSDLSYNEFEITQNMASHAYGMISPTEGEVGGGYWYAAKTDDGWVIASDGNGVILCSDVEPYGFPSAMISECY